MFRIPRSILQIRSLATQITQSTSAPPELDKLFKKIEFEVRGHDKAVLQSYMTFVQSACGHLDITHSKVENLPYVRWVEWLLRSKFVHKKYKLHYETRTYIKKCSVYNITGSTASTLVEYLQRQVPEGVGMKVTYNEMSAFPETISNQ
jgi:small subunit ribosomal protein S10|uniref:Small ribosomal subunit protein uS10m n=1 Tax=Panagrolaimus sp. PS1159 TaxID=55785 RepID=A0AC35FUM1_9BILA